MEEDLVALLLEESTLSALVGSKVWWSQAVQGEAPPYVTLRVISAPRDYHMQGASGLVESRVQIDCDAATYAAAKSVARAVEGALSGFKGTQGNTKFLAVFLDQERDSNEELTGTSKRMFRTSLDFLIWHGSA